MLGSNSVSSLDPPNDSGSTMREQLLMPTKGSKEATPKPTCINKGRIHWGTERQPTFSNNPQPSSHTVAAEVNIEEGQSITQRRDSNILVEPQPPSNLLPMERFLLCHPRDSATPYDIIQSRSMFGDVTTILSEIDALL